MALSPADDRVESVPRARFRRVGKTVLLLLVCGILFGGASFIAGVFVGEHQTRVGGVRGKSLKIHNGSEETVVPAPTEAATGRVVGEFEHQAAIMIGCNEMLAYHPRTLIQMVSALRTHVKILGLIWSKEQRKLAIDLLKANGLPEDCIDFYTWPAKSMWVRDFGPFFLMQGKNGPATVVGYAYAQPNRDYGDLFSASFAATLHYEFERAELSFEGGNLLTNGDGLCVTTHRILRQNIERGYEPNDPTPITNILAGTFRFNRWAHLNQLDGEPTGHADMFCTICGTNQAVVASYTQEQDAANADILDKNAATLAQEPTAKGPMKVMDLMPGHRDYNL